MIAERRKYTATVNGYELSIQRAGSGAPVLVLPNEDGFETWLPVMDRLAADFDVIVPEHPGFRESDRPSWLDNIHDLAYFYLEFLAAENLRNVNLVGFSLGGWVAAEIAVRNTSRLASLALVASAGLHVGGVKQIDTYLSTDEERIRGLYCDQTLADQALAATLEPGAEDIMLKNGMMAALLSWQPRNYDPHLYKWLHLIDVPTIVLWGDSDRLFPREYAYEFQRLIPKSEVVVFSNCGHMPQIEKAEDFGAALKRFLIEKGA
jgi:pimeloyl-ACP methyl ester carboxylesterase